MSTSPSPSSPERLAPPAAVLDRLPACTFPPPGTALVCGVSGGADSLALLALTAAAGCEVEAVHVDHGQRPGSADEAAVVEAAATEVGAGFRMERVEVAAGPNLEARLRAARYLVLGPDAATGHTLDDQAETVLLNLIRGAGVVGLGAMRPGHRRPILSLRRSDTEAVCDAMGWTPVVDPSNADPTFRRNRLRHEVLPLLHEIAGRDVVPLLARAADHSRSAAESLELLADAVDPTDASALAAAPHAVAATAIRRWVRGATGDEYPIDAASVERVLEVARGHRRAAQVAGGHRVARSARRLRIGD